MVPSTRPPGPRGLLGLDGFVFRRDPLGFLTRLATRYGDVASFRTGPHECVLLNHPDHIRDVLVTHHEAFARGGVAERRSLVLGEGLLTTDGERHRRHRRFIRPAFHKERIRALADTIVDCGERFVASHWRAGETRPVLPDMRRLSLAVMMHVLFGPDASGDRARLVEDLTAAIGRLGRFGLTRRWMRVRLPRRAHARRAMRAIDQLDAPILRLIADRRRDGVDRGDMLSTLLLARDEAGGLSDEEIQDEVRTLLEAGHIAIGNALAWTWYLLARHPEIAGKMHAELDAVLGTRAATMDDLPQLAYVEMVLLESLRLYPPAWLVSRRALGACRVGAYVLPAGTSVLLCPYVTHRDARYFPDPGRFDPERWTQEARGSRPPHAYFPFSHGPQRCIGDGLAMVEAVLLLATLGRRWTPRLTSQRAPVAVPLMTLVPDRLSLRLERRIDLSARET